MYRRATSFPNRGSIIAAISIAMLVWAAWPRLPDQRIVRARMADGETQTFSLPIGDQRLARIQKRIDAWKVNEPLAEIGRTRWALEAAKHYAELRKQQAPTVTVARKSKTVLPASFTLPGSPVAPPEPETPASPDPATINWRSVHELQAHRLAKIRQQVDAAKAKLGPPPFSVLDVTRGDRPPIAFTCAALAGLIGYAIFAIWYHVAPPVQLSFGRESEPIAGDADCETSAIAMHVPSKWVHLHQPAAVVARSVAIAVLLVAGLLSAWAAV